MVKAVTVEPMVAGSVRFEEVPEPDESTGSILVEAVAVGVCGTDVEITSGAYGWSPPGRERLMVRAQEQGPLERERSALWQLCRPARAVLPAREQKLVHYLRPFRMACPPEPVQAV